MPPRYRLALTPALPRRAAVAGTQLAPTQPPFVSDVAQGYTYVAERTRMPATAAGPGGPGESMIERAPMPATAPRESAGSRAERHVHDRLRAALPPEYALFPNVTWLVRDRGADREGEADLVIAHPDRGFVAIEVKSGPISRDGLGRWWAGDRRLDRPPFEQARDSQHSLVRKLRELPDWPAGVDPIAGHAVAFPDVELVSLGTQIHFLGPDTDVDLILDKALLSPGPEQDAHLRAWVDRAFDLWAGSGARRAPGAKGVELLSATITSPLEMRSLLRGRRPV